MVNNQTMLTEEPISARSEIIYVNHRESDKKRSSPSQLKVIRPVRSASQRLVRPAGSAYCAHCQLPLLIDVNTHETINKSRASTTLQSEHICHECNQDKVKISRSPSSRLVRSASINWSNVSDKIETWFDKARTPDQRVVYNFLEKINSEQDKNQTAKPVEPTQDKSLDDILVNLKKYRRHYDSSRPRSKFTRVFESSSWRVMRHPSKSHQFSRYNADYGDEASRDIHIGTVFQTTARKLGSTFLIHPDWV